MILVYYIIEYGAFDYAKYDNKKVFKAVNCMDDQKYFNHPKT
jgi:hypothetical protein